MLLQISRPSESGSMMSSRIRSGLTWRQRSTAPLPVCKPVSAKPFFFQVVFEEREKIRIVFDHKNLLHDSNSNSGFVTVRVKNW